MPDPPEGFRGKRDTRTRREHFEADERAGQERPYLSPPSVPFGSEHIVERLFDVGPTCDGAVISWREIAAWADMSGTIVEPWEAGLLRQLSVAFINERDAAKSPTRPPPGFVAEPTPAQRDEVAREREAYWDRMLAKEAPSSQRRPAR